MFFNMSLPATQRQIGRKLIILVILFSSAITLITTALQLYREFELNVGTLRNSVHQLEASNFPSIKEALWALDFVQLKYYWEES